MPVKTNMKTVQIASLRPSAIALGSSYFGSSMDEGLSLALLERFADLGGTCIDTARAYGAWFDAGPGAAERVIGRFLARAGRERFTVVTKGGYLPEGSRHIPRLSPQELRDDLDRSQAALGLDVIDLYLVHRDDPRIPVQEVLETLTDFVESGRVRHIGCSNWHIDRIREAQDCASRAGLTPFATSQLQWSLAESTPARMGDLTLACMDAASHAWYTENAMPVMAFSAQAKGFFAKGVPGGVDALSEKARARFGMPDNYARLSRVRTFAQENAISGAAVALAAILCDPLPAVAVIGPSSVAQLEDSLTAADLTLSPQALACLKYGIPFSC